MSVPVRKAVFARIASRPIPRVTRMMQVASDLGFEATFCGAIRDRGLQQSEEHNGWQTVRLGRYFPLLNGRRPFTYARSVFSYNRALYRFLKQEAPELVHASDIETMPAASLYRLRHGKRLIYNIHDNLSQRYRTPKVIAAFLNFAEGICVRRSDITLVPEEFRRSALPSWCQRKVSVVRNTVEDNGFAAPDADDGKIRIFFGGWLDWGRGLEALLAIADDNPDFEIRLAGEGSPEIIAEIQKHPQVAYLGFVNHDVIMQETRRCHFVSALYDPSRPINRFAASNKIAEALSVGRPVIINSEMRIARDLVNKECAVVTEYADAARLADRLRNLFDDNSTYRAACDAARLAYEADYAWLPVRERIEQAISGGESIS